MFSVLEGSLCLSSVVKEHGERQIQNAYNRDLSGEGPGVAGKGQL